MSKLLIFSAPSGAGKTTLVKAMLEQISGISFSISATSRKPREGEINGKDYHFLTAKEFKQRVAEDAFLEWEEVYENLFYGTLKSEVDRIWAAGEHVIFDVDVVGGLNIKKQYGNKALAVFVRPPSVDALRKRLIGRDTDSTEAIEMRIAKAEEEMKYASDFDIQITNDVLEIAIIKTVSTVSVFLEA